MVSNYFWRAYRSTLRQHAKANTQSSMHRAHRQFDPTSRRQVDRYSTHSNLPAHPHAQTHRSMNCSSNTPAPALLPVWLAVFSNQATRCHHCLQHATTSPASMCHLRSVQSKHPAAQKLHTRQRHSAKTNPYRVTHRMNSRSSLRYPSPFAQAPARQARDNHSPTPHANGSVHDICRQSFGYRSCRGYPKLTRRDSSRG